MGISSPSAPPALCGRQAFAGLVRRAELPGILHDVVHEPVAFEDVIDDAEFLRFFERKKYCR